LSEEAQVLGIFQSPFFIPIIAVILSATLSFVIFYFLTAWFTTRRRIRYERKLRKYDDHLNNIKEMVLKPVKNGIKEFFENSDTIVFKDDWNILEILQNEENKERYISDIFSNYNRFAKNLEAKHRDDELFLDIKNHFPDFYSKVENFEEVIKKIRQLKQNLVNSLEFVYNKSEKDLTELYNSDESRADLIQFNQFVNIFLRTILFRALYINEKEWKSTAQYVNKDHPLWVRSSIGELDFKKIYPKFRDSHNSLKNELEQMIQDIDALQISQKELKGKCSFLG